MMEIRTDEDGIKFRVPYSNGWLKISSAMIAGQDALAVELPRGIPTSAATASSTWPLFMSTRPGRGP